MPENIEPRRVPPKSRRKKAVLSALLSGGWLLFSAAVMLLLRQVVQPGGILSVLLLALSVLDAALLLPLAFCLRQRLREIQGGEEDEACQY